MSWLWDKPVVVCLEHFGIVALLLSSFAQRLARHTGLRDLFSRREHNGYSGQAICVDPWAACEQKLSEPFRTMVSIGIGRAKTMESEPERRISKCGRAGV
jgi:hypothetical protein